MLSTGRFWSNTAHSERTGEDWISAPWLFFSALSPQTHFLQLCSFETFVLYNFCYSWNGLFKLLNLCRRSAYCWALCLVMQNSRNKSIELRNTTLVHSTTKKKEKKETESWTLERAGNWNLAHSEETSKYLRVWSDHGVCLQLRQNIMLLPLHYPEKGDSSECFILIKCLIHVHMIWDRFI